MFARKKNRQATIIVVATIVGALVVGGGAWATIWAVTHQDDQPAEAAPPAQTSEPSASPTPTPTPTPEPVELPASAVVEGLIGSWQGAGDTYIADVLPQVGDAADGDVAAYIDAPVVDESTEALFTTVAIEPGTYTFSAQVRQLAALPETVDAVITVNDEEIEIPEIDATWTAIEAEVEIPSGTTEAKIAVVVNGPVTGLGLDEVSLAADGADNLVPNPSFETVDREDGILNNALILRESSAAVGVGVAEGDLTWNLTWADGTAVADGTATAGSSGLGAISLADVDQGYYTLNVAGADGAAYSTEVAIVDYEGAHLDSDERLGATAHVTQPWYDGAAETLRAAGLSSARSDVWWDFNEKSPGVYEFDPAYKEEFGRLHSHGAQLMGIVNYWNPLYDGGLTPSSEAGVQAFGAYAAAIADEFDVVGLEVYNEFNHDRFNTSTCGQSPACYMPLLQSTKEHVEAVDPDVAVIAGATANYDGDWLREMWQVGAMQWADAVSFHPYNPGYYQNPVTLSQAIQDANDSMQSITGQTVPIWVTEFGYTTGNELGQAVTDEVQAARLAISEATVIGSGAQHFYWYDLIDDDPDPNKHEGNFGMFSQKQDGVSATAPKLSGFAQALIVNAISGREATGRDDVGENVFSWNFGEVGDQAKILWTANDSATAEYDAYGPVTVTELSGAERVIDPEGGKVRIDVGGTPVILTGGFGAEDPSTASPEPTEQPEPTDSATPEAAALPIRHDLV